MHSSSKHYLVTGNCTECNTGLPPAVFSKAVAVGEAWLPFSRLVKCLRLRCCSLTSDKWADGSVSCVGTLVSALSASCTLLVTIISSVLTRRLPGDPELAGYPVVLFLQLFWKKTLGNKWQRFTQLRCPSCHPANNFQALWPPVTITYWSQLFWIHRHTLERWRRLLVGEKCHTLWLTVSPAHYNAKPSVSVYVVRIKLLKQLKTVYLYISIICHTRIIRITLCSSVYNRCNGGGGMCPGESAEWDSWTEGWTPPVMARVTYDIFTNQKKKIPK